MKKCEVCGEEHETLYKFEGCEMCSLCCMQWAECFDVHPEFWPVCSECGEIVPPDADYGINGKGLCPSCFINNCTKQRLLVS